MPAARSGAPAEAAIVVTRERRLPAHELAACDFSFVVEEETLPPYDGPAIVNVAAVAPYRKAYEDPGVHKPGEILFAARRAGVLCGYVIVSRGWNNYCQIEDIAVDRRARRLGVGALLLDAAVGWARAQKYPGVRLETQSNNVPACRLYARYGFMLGGHDRYLYSELPDQRRPETALYWYLFFDGDANR